MSEVVNIFAGLFVGLVFLALIMDGDGDGEILP